MASPPKSIDDYLKGVPPSHRAALQKVRKQILAIVPGASECISYSMPAFRLNGHVVAGFLSTSQGCSFFPFSGTTLDSVAAELSGYSRTKSALHFDPARGLPTLLLRKLLKARKAELPVGTPGKKAAKKAAAKRKRVAKNEQTPTRRRA